VSSHFVCANSILAAIAATILLPVQLARAQASQNSPVAEQSESLPNPAGAADADGKSGADNLDKLLDMADKHIEDLSKVSVATPTAAALTEVSSDRNIVPAAVTKISKEDIYRSGARNLDEVLEIFVPNLEKVDHHWEQNHLGLRGIISDREDKYLLLVNGRIMNERTHAGAVSERLVPEITDINRIEVIRGPGSAVYGPGAVSMVVAIYTDTAQTFNGTKATVREGFVDEFSTYEIEHGFQWDDAKGGVLLYAGIGTQDGASQKYAPLVLATSDPGNPGFGNPTVLYQGYKAGHNVTNPINNMNESFEDQMPLKFFADVTYDDFEVWGRYTRSGIQFPLAPAAGLNFPAGFGTFVDQQQSETGNQQVSVQSKYETQLDKDLKFVSTLGWDHTEFARVLFSGVAEAFGEEDLNVREMLIRQIGDHQVAIGGEFYNDVFGLPTSLIDAPPTDGRLGADFHPWTTQTYSVFGEDQWQINDEWTTFVGARWDNNTYTPWMFSPRVAVVYTPNKETAWKAILNQSQRMNFAEELRSQWLNNRTLSEPEVLKSAELRLERNPTDCFSWAVSTFFIDLDAISWDQTHSSSSITGNQKQWGVEGEWQYKTGCWQIVGSHCYTKLLNFTLTDPTVTTFISAAPDGFGNDLDAWANNITKVFVHRQLNETWAVDSSVRYYWGFPGSKDINDRNNSIPGSFAQSVPNYKTAFEGSVFYNLGLEYRYSRCTRFRVDGYNLLGVFQSDLNKRIFYGDNSFISEAPAVGVSGEMRF
jgi:outer membrane receptor protein involved in Fe transport